MKKIALLLTLLTVIGACGERKLTPDDELENIADIYDRGDLQTASVELKKFVERHPDHDRGWTILGHTYEDLDQNRNAADAYRRAIALNPKRAEAVTGMGILARKRGDDAEAMRQYRKAVELDPDYAQAYSSMAVISLRNGRDKEALRYARKAWELDDSDPGLAANLAAAYHYNGMTAERDEMTEKAKKMGYAKIDTLQEIYRGEKTLRKDE